MRTTLCSAIGAILIFFAVCGSASEMMCNNNADDLKKLYKYAQLAEAAKSGNWGGMEDCVDNDGETIIANRPSDIVKVSVPQEFIRLVMDRVAIRDEEENRDDNKLMKFAKLQPSQPDSPQFHVGCSSRKKTVMAIQLTLSVITSNTGVLFYLTGTEVTGTVVDASGEPVSIIHSTTWDPQKIRANWEGEDCVFPLVETTVGALCEVLRERGDGPVYSAFVRANEHLEANGNSVFSYSSPWGPWSQSLNMVGHSLGGSATQYVASNLPDECRPDEGFEFEAYAFSSPGLRNEENACMQSTMLQSFIIDGDLLLRLPPFWNNFQLGQIAFFTPPDSHISIHAHSIDGVQEGICSCLRGEGKIVNSVGSKTNREIFKGKPY